MKVSATSLALPLLAGLAAFSSKDRFPDRELTLFFSWSFFIISSVIAFRLVRHRTPIAMMIAVVLLLRVALVFHELPSWAHLAYLGGTFVLVVVCGFAVFVSDHALLLRQMRWLALASIVMSLLQMSGVPWAQSFGSAAADKGLTDEEVYFARYGDVEFAGLLQTRPDGFTHANNLSSQLLLLFLACELSAYLRSPKPGFGSVLGLFLLFFAAALNGGKVIILGIALVLGAAMICIRMSQLPRWLGGTALILSAYYLYYTIFPGIFVTNFNPDLFVHNASDRIVNLGSALGTDSLRPLATWVAERGTGRYITEHYIISHNFKTEEVGDSYSGLARMGVYTVFLLPFASGLWLAWSHNKGRIMSGGLSWIRLDAILLSAALASCLMGGAFYQTVWFCFFLAPLLTPLLIHLCSPEGLTSMARGLRLRFVAGHGEA